MSDILNQQQQDLQLQLQELVKVGVGGKFKDNSDYTKRIQEELEFEDAMLQGGIDRFRKTVKDAIAKGQESTTLHGLVLQQKYITKLSLLINGDIKRHKNLSRYICIDIYNFIFFICHFKKSVL